MKSSAGRAELDSMIVEVELTLVSIIQGVALSFLIDGARSVMSIQKADLCVVQPFEKHCPHQKTSAKLLVIYSV